MPQRGNRMLAGGLRSGIEAKYQADNSGNTAGNQDGINRYYAKICANGMRMFNIGSATSPGAVKTCACVGDV